MALFLVLMVFAVAPSTAFAYLDPGSGNALVYLIISLSGACAYFFKGVFYKILGIFGKQTKKESVRQSDLILFSEGPTYWYTWKPLIEELINRKIPFQYLSLDVRDPGLTIDNPLMQSRFMGFGSAAYARVAQCKGKIMLSTTPNIGCDGYPLPRPKSISQLVHVSHGVGDISYLKKGSLDYYDVDLDIGAWCEKRMRQIEKLRNLKPKEFHAVGLLYLDELANGFKPKSTSLEKPTILVAPSWGDKCSLKVHNEHYVEDLLKAGFKVIFRPHPQSFRFDVDLIARVVNTCSNYEGFVLDREIDARVHMAEADILISDSSAFRFDFAFLMRRPVITLLVPTENLSSFEAGELGGPWETDIVPRLGAVVKPGEPIDLPKLVLKVLKTPSEQIDRLYESLVANHGTAARRIIDWVENELRS